jgi:hypothetical protein
MSDRPLASTEPIGTHPSADVLRAYVAGHLGPDAAVRVDLHIERCPHCRFTVNEQATEGLADRDEANLLAIAGAIDAPRHGIVERGLVALGAPVDTVRLMMATPSLRRSWYLAVLLAVLFGMAAASPDRPASSIQIFLGLSPLLPVVGVALAYGPGVDPSYEMTVAAPLSGFRLVMIRSVAVLAASIAIVGVASLLLLPRHTLIVAAWIVPALSLSLVCLALMTVLRPRVAAAVVVAGWLGLLAATSGAFDQLALFSTAGQLSVAATGAIGGLVVVTRRRSYDASRGDLA